MKLEFPAAEHARLELIRDLNMSDPNPRLESLIRIARHTFGTEAVAITLLDADTQWIKAASGLPFRHCQRRDSICQYTLLAEDGQLLIDDLSVDERFTTAPLVCEHGFRSYAGKTLYSREGFPLGAFCVLDTVPRRLTSTELAVLGDLAALAEREFHLCEVSQHILKKQVDGWNAMDRATDLQAIVDHLPVLVAYVGRDGRYRYANAIYKEWSGLDYSSIIGKTIIEVVGPEHAAELEPHTQQALSGKQAIYETSHVIMGLHRHLRGVLTPDLREDGSIPGYYLMVQDITARKTLEDTLMQQAREDPLTGLPNRRAALEQITAALNRQTRVKKGLAVMFLDLDGFKGINDSLGHDAGDALLQQFAGRLLTAVRSTDMVARLAGDEFVILLEHLGNAEADCRALASKLIKAINLPFILPQGSVSVTTSIGIALNQTAQPVMAETLVSEADQAMYRAKRQGKNRYVLSAARPA